jgi:hypothetical protein
MDSEGKTIYLDLSYGNPLFFVRASAGEEFRKGLSYLA